MTDNDLIRRGDALELLQDGLGLTLTAISKRIAALPAASPKPVAVMVKPLVWAKIETAPRGGEWFIARTERGTARVVHYADEYDRFPISHDSEIWETPPVEWIPLSRILSAITLRPESEVRAEAWAAAVEAAANTAAEHSCTGGGTGDFDYYRGCADGYHSARDQIVEAIRALTPPDDIAALLAARPEPEVTALVYAAKGLLFAHDHGQGLEGWHETRERMRAALAAWEKPND